MNACWHTLKNTLQSTGTKYTRKGLWGSWILIGGLHVWHAGPEWTEMGFILGMIGLFANMVGIIGGTCEIH
ncbi:MAG TPA: hypothetical protein DD856_08050 [Sulfobacillus sp.]|nr:hypothetical protein [Sulfobacillus sp.]